MTNDHDKKPSSGELGVTNRQGKPYPSAGFTAVYVMAHEVK